MTAGEAMYRVWSGQFLEATEEERTTTRYQDLTETERRRWNFLATVMGEGMRFATVLGAITSVGHQVQDVFAAVSGATGATEDRDQVMTARDRATGDIMARYIIRPGINNAFIPPPSGALQGVAGIDLEFMPAGGDGDYSDVANVLPPDPGVPS